MSFPVHSSLASTVLFLFRFQSLGIYGNIHVLKAVGVGHHAFRGLSSQTLINQSMFITPTGSAIKSTRKLSYGKDDRAMRLYMGALLVCSSTPLFPTPPLVSPKFPRVPLGVGGWPLGYEERRCWANCSCN